MNPDHSKAIGNFFERQWDLYQRAIRANVLCHGEMFAALDRLLTERFGDRPFSFIDFGCGDASAVFPTLLKKRVTHYTGIDAASDLIATASLILDSLNCQKTLICQDMATAITEISVPVDVIFCSYSLHHLIQDEKAKFIQNCYQLLKSPGYFILVDGIAREHETREEWLERLEQRILQNVPDFTPEDCQQIMQHPREYDFPETIATFRRIAQQSPWRSFETVIERDDFLAFMVFAK